MYIGLIFFVAMAIGFYALEKLAPGRALPMSKRWYVRAAMLNLTQLGVVVLAGHLWGTWLQGASLLDISHSLAAPFQGLVSWFIGTFIFYWWHRARHDFDILWRCLHQIHHSASRIEVLTAFYKHPLEMASNSIIISFVLFVVLGATPEAAVWFNVIAAAGELFYHSNLRTPHWVGYFMQRPEHHSIHHELGVHDFNFGDITWWDRLFGTFKDTDAFAPACGFKDDLEERLGEMMLFRDVHRDTL